MSKMIHFLNIDRKNAAFGATIIVMSIFLFCLGLLIPADLPAGPKEVRYPVTQFDNGQAQHYYLNGPKGVVIRFFILKSSDGIIRAAFDACDVCYRANKGYTQKGDVMVCNNCGLEFKSTKINEVKGGCNPSPLKRKIKDGQVVIRINDIMAGAQYFDLQS